MEATLEQIPRTGKVDLTIQVSATINYSAEVARRLAGRFVANEIGYLLRCGDPKLVVSERLYWRVPIILALPTTGPIGTVGTIDVDVETGQTVSKYRHRIAWRPVSRTYREATLSLIVAYLQAAQPVIAFVDTVVNVHAPV